MRVAGRLSRVIVAAISMTALRADEFTFSIDQSLSSADLTMAGYFFGNEASTRSTQTFPLTGTLTLDVNISDGVVTSVDFVSFSSNYVATAQSPVTFTSTATVGQFMGQPVKETFPFGTETTSYPAHFDEVVDPRMWLEASSKGTEGGTGAALTLASPALNFEGSSQAVLNPTRPGKPITAHHPYPSGIAHPDAVTLGANYFDGVVSIVGSSLVFNGTYLSSGVAGGAQIKYTHIHRGTVVATAANAIVLPVEPKVSTITVSSENVSLTWASEVNATYRILGSTDLKTYPLTLEEGVPSQGVSTTQAIAIPTEMKTEKRGFFKIEKE